MLGTCKSSMPSMCPGDACCSCHGIGSEPYRRARGQGLCCPVLNSITVQQQVTCLIASRPILAVKDLPFSRHIRRTPKLKAVFMPAHAGNKWHQAALAQAQACVQSFMLPCQDDEHVAGGLNASSFESKHHRHCTASQKVHARGGVCASSSGSLSYPVKCRHTGRVQCISDHFQCYRL